MLSIPIRITLLGSVAALSLGAAHAQTEQQPQGQIDPQACATLANRLGDDTAIEAQVRAQVEDVISSGDVTQCQLVVTAWEEEGMITQNSLELVATEQVTERMIVQQEVEVAAEAAVYQPPAEVEVQTGAPEVVWTLPRQSVTVDEAAPEITVRQGQPRVVVEVPQPRVTVMMPEPEVIVTWPDATVDMAALEPIIEVRVPEPVVTVNMPDPVVELTIGGGDPEGLVRLDDGRFAPRGASAEDLEPRIAVQQEEAAVTPGQQAEAPEIIVNRTDPIVTLEGQDPEVTVEVVGEPEIRVMVGNEGAQTDAMAPGAVQPEAGSMEQADN